MSQTSRCQVQNKIMYQKINKFEETVQEEMTWGNYYMKCYSSLVLQNAIRFLKKMTAMKNLIKLIYSNLMSPTTLRNVLLIEVWKHSWSFFHAFCLQMCT